MSDDREVKFWDTEDAEELTITDFDEAVQNCLDMYHTSPYPVTITICGYAPRKFDFSADDLAVQIAENLDDHLVDFGNPDESTQLPPVINEAIETLAVAICKHWPVYRCEAVETIKVNVKQWMEANWPDAFEGPFPVTFQEDNEGEVK